MNYSKHFRIEPGKNVKLSKIDPSYTGGLNKAAAQPMLEQNIQRLVKNQAKLYAENRRSLLVILQGMDTCGKDGTVRHVMSGINPLGCTVTSFKAPSSEELDHDFLWRIHKAIPAKGDIGIFNRSQYEDVLIVRVKNLVPTSVWKPRYDRINEFELMLTESGVTILKFFLCISKDEQKERLQARLDDPDKRWKFNPNDLKEREYWDDYMNAYEDVLSRCSTKHAPWFIIPANKKWFRNLAVSEIIDETLDRMDLKIPKPDFDPTKIKVR